MIDLDRFVRPGVDAHAVAAAWALAWMKIRQAWPGLAMDEEEILSFVAERVELSESSLATCPLEDLALAAQCVKGDRAAHLAFETYLTAVDLARVGGAASHLFDDVKQQLRVQLLVAGDKPAGLSTYRGRGPLRAWIRIIATRELIRLTRRKRLDSTTDVEDLALAGTGDPALDQLKETYRTEFAEALRDAISDLSFEDRLLLRQQIADQLSIDQIGVAHGVHRGTASRWVARAREALLEATRRRLAERLDLPSEEIASVIRLVHSRLDVSVVRYLRDAR